MNVTCKHLRGSPDWCDDCGRHIGARPNVYADRARSEKVTRIVTALVTGKHATTENLRATAQVLASATPWGAALSEAIAKRCGEHTLSMTTRALVATRLEEVVGVMETAEREAPLLDALGRSDRKGEVG